MVRPPGLVYPVLPPSRRRLADRAAMWSGGGPRRRFGPIRCPVCGSRGFVADFATVFEWLRESGRCPTCQATNRHRQLGLTLSGSVCEHFGTPARAVRDLREAGLRIHNTETSGPLHGQLVGSPGYTASEYFSPDTTSGELVGGVMHQDLMALSFESASIDVIISSDVFEHVADPYRGHAEIFRVLRPGGFHVFTIPFLEREYTDRVQASLRPDGSIEHHVEPVYHADPINPVPGALVFTVFSLEMLVRLREIGFETRLYWLHRPSAGIVGQEATVFVARKPPTSRP